MMSDSTPITPPPAAGGPAPLSDAETRQWAGLAHMLNVLGILPSLIIWLVYKDRSALVGQEARTSLNFMLAPTAVWIVMSGLVFVLPILLVQLLNLAIWVVVVILSYQNYQAVNRGQAGKYPFSLDLIH
jgi:uncharacterized protein